MDELADAAHETFAVLETLLQELGSRESASEEEVSATRYLVDRYEGHGFSMELQAFTTERISTGISGFSIETPVQEKFDAIPVTSTGIGTASGPLAPVDWTGQRTCLQAICPGNPTEKIALVRRGSIPFQDKGAHVFDAGAAGAVIYNNQTGNVRGRLAFQVKITVPAISRVEGERIEVTLEAGEVVASVAVHLDAIPSRNVVA